MNHRHGTMADLARNLGISRSAVSKAFQKHNIQRTSDGIYNLDYLEWLLSQKQNQRRSEGQRAARKKLPGLDNPRLKREVLRGMVSLWQSAAVATLADHAEKCRDDEGELDELAVMEILDYWNALSIFWEKFHALADDQWRDPADLDFEIPAAFDFDIFTRDQAELKNFVLGLCIKREIEQSETEALQ